MSKYQDELDSYWRKERQRRANQIKGWKNKRKGQAHEASIEQQAGLSPDLIVVKQHVPSKFVGRGEIRPTGEKAEPDYFAFYYGNPFVFEAKSTKRKKKFSAPKNRQHQFDRMQELSEVGIPCFYLVWWDEHRIAELFEVHPASPWPFVMVRGTGVHSTASETYVIVFAKHIIEKYT